MTTTEKYSAIAIAIFSFILMQAHSLEYWIEATDSSSTYATIKGVAVSVAIEAAALWLWYTRGVIARVFSVLASAIVISSALFQVSLPLFGKVHTASFNSSKVEMLREEIEDHRKTLRQYEANSGSRSGWAPLITKVQAKLDASRDALKEALADKSDVQMDWRVWWSVGVQAAAMLVVMVAQILAVVSLRAPSSSSSGSSSKSPSSSGSEDYPKQSDVELTFNSEVSEEKVSVPSRPTLEEYEIPTLESFTQKPVKVPSENAVTKFDVRVERAAAAIRARLPLFEHKQKLFAQYAKLREADISMILNNYSKERKEKVREKALAKVEEAMGLSLEVDT